MNPPFALKRGAEKEYKFVDQALKQMEDGGLLFSILPYSCMVKPRAFKVWRKELLRKNTLLSVVTFPQDLFYPVGVYTVGVFVRKGIPHPRIQNVLWIRALTDGLLKSKGKRLPSNRTSNDIEGIKDLLRAYLVNPSLAIENIHQFQKACPIDYDDTLLELVPEAYLDQSPPTEDQIRLLAESLTRESVAFLIKTGNEV